MFFSTELQVTLFGNGNLPPAANGSRRFQSLFKADEDLFVLLASAYQAGYGGLFLE